MRGLWEFVIFLCGYVDFYYADFQIIPLVNFELL